VLLLSLVLTPTWVVEVLVWLLDWYVIRHAPEQKGIGLETVKVRPQARHVHVFMLKTPDREWPDYHPGELPPSGGGLGG
jgi:hypothetical protein